MKIICIEWKLWRLNWNDIWIYLACTRRSVCDQRHFVSKSIAKKSELITVWDCVLAVIRSQKKKLKCSYIVDACSNLKKKTDDKNNNDNDDNCHEYHNKGNNDYNDVMMIKIMNKYYFQYLPRVS